MRWMKIKALINVNRYCLHQSIQLFICLLVTSYNFIITLMIFCLSNSAFYFLLLNSSSCEITVQKFVILSILFYKNMLHINSHCFKRKDLKQKYSFLSLNCSCQFNSNSNCRQLLLLALLRPLKMVKRQYYMSRYFHFSDIIGIDFWYFLCQS